MEATNKWMDFDCENDSPIQQVMEKFCLELQDKKVSVIRNRMKEIGIEIDEDQERNRRFKRLLVEKHESGVELYFYDDGSTRGLFIIGFRLKDNSMDYLKPDYEPFKVTMGYDILTENPFKDDYKHPSVL